MAKEEFKDWEEEYKYYEEKYYPITWEINKSEIEIHSKDGNILPKDHEIYNIEWNFIYEQINDYRLFSGEINCI